MPIKDSLLFYDYDVYSILNEEASIVSANTSCHQKALYLCELVIVINIKDLEQDRLTH